MDWFQGTIGEAIQTAKLQKARFVVVIHGEREKFDKMTRFISTNTKLNYINESNFLNFFHK